MRRIALVGHCGVDGPRLEAAIERAFDDETDVLTIGDSDALTAAVNDGVDLFLFNRELGHGFDAGQGVAVISALHADDPQLKLMLISDRPEAQRAAEAAGALPGFGKADLGSLKVETALRNAVT